MVQPRTIHRKSDFRDNNLAILHLPWLHLTCEEAVIQSSLLLYCAIMSTAIPNLYSDRPEKPLLRGVFHRYGFYACTLLGLTVLIFAKNTLARISFLVYLLTLLSVYGVSSTYHLTKWKDVKAETFWLKMDYSCIYLLIAGTYTPICALCFPFETQRWPLTILVLIWIIAALGILRTIFFTNIPKLLNVSFYILMGFVLIPYMPLVFQHVDFLYGCSFVLGGLIYTFGGLVFGFERPNPLPHYFGYHEIFHLCTVLGNLCFAVPIVIKTVSW